MLHPGMPWVVIGAIGSLLLSSSQHIKAVEFFQNTYTCATHVHQDCARVKSATPLHKDCKSENRSIILSTGVEIQMFDMSILFSADPFKRKFIVCVKQHFRDETSKYNDTFENKFSKFDRLLQTNRAYFLSAWLQQCTMHCAGGRNKMQRKE